MIEKIYFIGAVIWAIGIFYYVVLILKSMFYIARGKEVTLTWDKKSFKGDCLHKAVSEFYQTFMKKADEKVVQYLKRHNLTIDDWKENGEKREYRHGNISKTYFYYKDELVVTVETEMTDTGVISRII